MGGEGKEEEWDDDSEEEGRTTTRRRRTREKKKKRRQREELQKNSINTTKRTRVKHGLDEEHDFLSACRFFRSILIWTPVAVSSMQ